MSLLVLIVALIATPSQRQTPDASGLRGELIFPLESKHNHGSCVVECPNGDLLACWYNGSGERSADDVRVLGARLTNPKSEIRNPKWSPAFVMADTPGFPDCNPCMVVDPLKRLWLLWPVILDNHWESALMKYRISRDYQRSGAPRWETNEVLHIKPGPEFAQTVDRDLDAAWASALQAEPQRRAEFEAYGKRLHENARNALKVRLGWMTRVHPFIDGHRMLVTLYSDGFDFSMMAITDDGGKTWKTSAPIVGQGNVQPTIAKRKDGTLVAFFRDNGRPPQRAMVSESRDRGMTWTMPRDIELFNPGSGLDVVVLKSGRWLLVYNDTERGRHSLAVSVSEDEGRTWPITRWLEHDERGPGAGSYSYPSLIQAENGAIHVTYSYSPPRGSGKNGESIKHVQFPESWLLEGRAK